MHLSSLEMRLPTLILNNFHIIMVVAIAPFWGESTDTWLLGKFHLSLSTINYL